MTDSTDIMVIIIVLLVIVNIVSCFEYNITYYIDPTYSSGDSDGTMEKPYTGFDFLGYSGTNQYLHSYAQYLIKRGTVYDSAVGGRAYMGGGMVLRNVVLGAYGDDDGDNRPVYRCDVASGSIISIGGNGGYFWNVVIQDLEIYNGLGRQGVVIGGSSWDSNSGNFVIQNCKLHTAGTGIWFMASNGGSSTDYNFKILNNEIFNIDSDGIFVSDITGFEIAGNYMYKVNQDFNKWIEDYPDGFPCIYGARTALHTAEYDGFPFGTDGGPNNDHEGDDYIYDDDDEIVGIVAGGGNDVYDCDTSGCTPGGLIGYLDVASSGTFYIKYCREGRSRVGDICHDQLDDRYCGGDAIQVSNVVNVWIHDNIIDRRYSSNKFNIIFGYNTFSSRNIIIEDNEFYGPLDFGDGCVSLFIDNVDNITIRYNKILGPYSSAIAGGGAHEGYVYGNIFAHGKNGMHLPKLGSNGDYIFISNNIFYNITEGTFFIDGWSSVERNVFDNKPGDEVFLYGDKIGSDNVYLTDDDVLGTVGNIIQNPLFPIPNLHLINHNIITY